MPLRNARHLLLAAVAVSLAWGSRPAAAAVPCAGDVSGAGRGTYYTYTPGTGACTFTGDDTDAMVAAINAADYDGSAMCGRWLRVTGPLGSATVRIIDACPDCAAGDVDMSATAFAMIGNPVDGQVPVTWETVAGPASPTISLKTHEGSNNYWLGLQVRGHRYGISKLEFLGPSGYVTAPRQSYNVFVVDGSIVSVPILSPFTVRLTDVNGQQVVVAGVPLSAGSVHATAQQFPLCADWVAPAPQPAAQRTALMPPVPNPFNPRTTVAFELEVRTAASLRVFTLDGRLIATLLDNVMLEAGRHGAEWDGRAADGQPVAGGQYLLRLEAGDRVEVQKALLLK